MKFNNKEKKKPRIELNLNYYNTHFISLIYVYSVYDFWENFDEWEKKNLFDNLNMLYCTVLCCVEWTNKMNWMNHQQFTFRIVFFFLVCLFVIIKFVTIFILALLCIFHSQTDTHTHFQHHFQFIIFMDKKKALEKSKNVMSS